MMTNAKVGVAVVGGYLLGRTKKAKVAMGLGMFLAGRRMKLDPQQIKNLVTESPVFAGLNDQVRKELVDATKSAATSALTKRAGSLADSLNERRLGLNKPSSEGGSDQDDDFLEEDEPGGGTGTSEEDDAAESSPREPAEDRGSRTKPAGRPPKQSGRAKSAGSASGARKTAGGAARKGASGTRRTAGGAARKVATRGGERG